MPENYSEAEHPDFDRIARYYDLLYADRFDDLAMCLAFSDELDGEILEIGCGTGRITLPLLQQGQKVTGIDLSATALEAARAKLQAVGFSDAPLYQADMRDFDLPQKAFALAFIPVNTFMHCLTTKEQLETLQAVYKHLRPGGAIVIDLFHPSLDTLAEADGRMLLEDELPDEMTGHTAQVFVVRRLEADRQIQHVTFILDELRADGTLARDTFSFPMRYIHRYEMELLLIQSGFTPPTVFGDYDLSPFSADSPRMIFVAEKTVGE
ncbi:MAG TPA: class I SAM-dependent methyltransferase [Chloroflexi bacterium]|nr:class I SAM-dependent methyltransferase [Chloroflexota bacterium]